MRHGYTILNQSVNALTEYEVPKNALHSSIAKRQPTVKKVLYVIFFDNKGLVYAITCSKGQNSHRSIL